MRRRTRSSVMPSTPEVAAPPTRRERLRIYRSMFANRSLEERLTALYRQGQITGGFYRSLGQEATSVGSAMALERDDILAPMIRNLGSLLVRGVRPRDIVANYLAKGEGPTLGKDNVVHFGTVDGAGSFRLDERGGLVSCISPLGNLPAVLAGMALAARLQGKSTVCMTYVGDGATSTGEFHEGMNFACALGLAVVVIVENNGWAYSTPVSRQTLLVDLAERAALYGCPGIIVDGQDVEAVLAVTRNAIARARAGQGPTLIEAKTYRIKGHAEHDDQHYVPPGEVDTWTARDPLALYRAKLTEIGIAAAEVSEVERSVAEELEREVAEAVAMPPADPRVVLEGVYNAPEMDEWTRRSRVSAFLGKA